MNTRAVVLCAGLLGAACGGDAEPAADGGDNGAEVIPIMAHQWAYDPNSIRLHKGVPVILELTSGDVHHGFNLPDLGVRADILPGKPTRVRVTPNKVGTFQFHCDYFCGSGHEDMDGEIVVE